MKSIFTWFLYTPASDRSPVAIIKWWEVRRIPYNILIGAYGIISLLLFYFFIESSGQLEPGEDAVEPLAIIAAPIVINIAYTAGWFVEMILRYIFAIKSMRTGPRLLLVGVVFSLIIVTIPSAVWGYIYFKTRFG